MAPADNKNGSSRVIIAVLSALLIAGLGGLGSVLVHASMIDREKLYSHEQLSGHAVTLQKVDTVEGDIGEIKADIREIRRMIEKGHNP